MRLYDQVKTASRIVLCLLLTFATANQGLSASALSANSFSASSVSASSLSASSVMPEQVDALVDKNNKLAFSTVAQAIEQAPNNLSKPYIIKIAAGEYYEKLLIDKPFITLLGESAETTRLYFDDYSGKKTANGSNLGTSNSATLTIRAPNFRAENLHIENAFNFPYYDAMSTEDPQRVSGMQAVAVLTDKGSDKALFKNVKMSGYQDTLYTKSGRSLFLNNTISGHIDFIFGGGTAVFYKSNIVTRNRPNKSSPIGYITAPSTNIEQAFGLVFIDCALSRESGVADNSMGLGRPWHPTTTFADGRYADPNAVGQTVFINTWMGAHIQQSPWHPMGGTAKSGERTLFRAEDARFFESASTGPGAFVTATRRQLDKRDADSYTWKNILGDWYQTPYIQQAIQQVSAREVVSSLSAEMSEYTIENEYQKNTGQFPFISPINDAKNTNNLAQSISEYYNLRYKTVDGTELHLDLFHPTQSEQAKPLVVMVHGGGWRTGNKSHQTPTARWLASQGFVAVSVEYRTSKKALYPTGMEDINDAIKWLKLQHKTYLIDTTKVAVLGASSGAHMATLLGTMGTNPDTNSPYEAVQAIVNIDGVADLTSADARMFEDKPGKISYAALWIGGRYEKEPKRWHSVSPIEYLSKNTPPTLFINSSHDRFHVGRDAFVAHLIKNNTHQEVHTIPDTPHTFWLFYPWVDNMRNILVSFLNEVLVDDKSSTVSHVNAETQFRSPSELSSYLLESKQITTMQKNAIAAEIVQVGEQKQAPTMTKFLLNEIRNKDQNHQALPRTMIQNMLSWQTPAGGWSKNTDVYTQSREEGQLYGVEESYLPTFDNGATTMQIIELKHALKEYASKDIETSLHKAINYLFTAQYPNGGFPQTYPLVGNYHDLVTYNDDVMSNITTLLNDMHTSPSDYALSDTQIAQAATHLALVLKRVIKDQVTVNPQQGAWGQQHDPMSYQLKPARAYEMAALSTMETARLLETLMRIDKPSAALKATITKGINWLKANQIIGIKWVRSHDKNSELINDKTAQGLWPRFIDKDTGKPVFGDRNGQTYASIQEVSIERQNAYAWYHTSQLSALRAHEKWHKKWQVGN